MTSEDVRNYCLDKIGVDESFPFDNETLVFKVGGKIFLLLPLEKIPFQFCVKTNPEWSEELREQFVQISGAYHLNKKHWNAVVCDGLDLKLLLKLIDHSYEIVFSSLTKKIKLQILES